MIKKTILLLAIFCLILNSCTDDIEINAPSLHATMGDELFRPDIKKAVLHEDGRLEINGTTGSKSIIISTNVSSIGTYKIADKSSQNGIKDISFQNTETNYSLETGNSKGEIIITAIFDNYVSGSFHFENLKSETGKTLNIQNGWFYMLPIELASDQIIEEEEEKNPCLLNATLTAKVDGTEVITNNHQAVPFGIREPFPSIRITARDGAQNIEIVFSVDTTPGTYNLSGSGDYSATYSLDNEKSASISGTLTVIEHNKESKCINGAFEYTTASGKQITDGVFNYGY